MADEDARQIFQRESEKLGRVLAEDDEVMWQYWECVWQGKRNAAKFIDSQVRPKVAARVRQQLQVVDSCLEALCR